jgi:hypothetical protein
VGRTDLSPQFKIVAWALALFRNAKTGCCNPSYLALADRAGTSERSAKRAIARLEELGLIAVTRTRGGRKNDRNQYTLILPQGVTERTPQGVTNKGCQNERQGLSELCHPNKKENKIPCGTPPEYPQGRRETRACAREAPLTGGGADAPADHFKRDSVVPFLLCREKTKKPGRVFSRCWHLRCIEGL